MVLPSSLGRFHLWLLRQGLSVSQASPGIKLLGLMAPPTSASGVLASPAVSHCAQIIPFAIGMTGVRVSVTFRVSRPWGPSMLSLMAAVLFPMVFCLLCPLYSCLLLAAVVYPCF